MKIPGRLAAVLCLVLMAAPALADVYSSALQKAHNVAEQNNARQGITGQPAPPPPAPPPAPDPILAATLNNITHLQADLALLETDPGRKQPLINDLNAAASGHRPSNGTVSKLADDLASVVSGKALSPEQLRKLAQALHAIFNGSHLSEAQQRTVLAETEKNLQSFGSMTADDARLHKLDEDMRAVIAATK